MSFCFWYACAHLGWKHLSTSRTWFCDALYLLVWYTWLSRKNLRRSKRKACAVKSIHVMSSLRACLQTTSAAVAKVGALLFIKCTRRILWFVFVAIIDYLICTHVSFCKTFIICDLIQHVTKRCKQGSRALDFALWGAVRS